MPVPTRQDTHNVTVSVDGRQIGLFDTKSGGELDSEENLYNPGGMLGQVCDRWRANDRERHHRTLL